MYRKHFALTRHPFDKELAADELFQSASLLELNARLKHLVDMRGIGLVTGDSGSGKTTTCRHLVSGLHSGLYRVLYVSLTTGNVMDLYKSIAWELGLPPQDCGGPCPAGTQRQRGCNGGADYCASSSHCL
jgi:general secretion pathway protein A